MIFKLAKQPGNSKLNSKMPTINPARAIRYGLSMSFSRDGNVQAARQSIKELLQTDPTNIWYLAAAAEIELDNNNPEGAEVLLSGVANSPRPDASVVKNYTVATGADGAFQGRKRLYSQVAFHS